MYTMPPVETDKPNFREESDYFPNMRPEDPNKGRWTKGLKASRQLTEKQQQLAQEAVRAWKSATGISWNEFTQNTTFHGIKYIFDSSPRAYKIRRFAWVTCVVASVLFFIIQVSLRVGVFFEYNTNVDVEKVYTTTMPFPAVTICNQNKFRLTVTSEKGLYGYTNAVYDGSTEAAIVEEAQQHNTEIDAEDFLQQTAHQLVDLIDSCTWKGRQCNTTEDWLMRQTDMGLCYTFNSGLNGEPALEVTESGAAQGLSLILNIEQYEYMMGPQNDAGIKILLHDQSEFPMIKDLGFAVAPGTHTLVGVNRFVIKSMEQPYGLCDKQRNESMSDCRYACYTREIVSRCGCSETYIGNETDVPLCSISQLFGCVKEEMERLQMRENNCSCTVPCTRINYEPALSYAQLSQLSIGRLVLKNAERKKAVMEQYKLAREVLQRTDPDILATDNATLTAIQSHIQAFTDTMDVVMSDIDASRDETLILNLQKSLDHDDDYLEDQIEDVIWPAIWDIVREFDQYKDCIHDIFQFLKSFNLPTQNVANVEDQLVQCLPIKCNPTAPEHGDGDKGGNGGNGGNEGPPDDQGPQGTLEERLSQVPDSCMKLANVLDSILLLPSKYASAIEGLFAGSLSDPSEIQDHLSCIVELDQIEDSSVVNATRQLTTLMRSMFGNSTQQDLLNAAMELVVVMNKTAAGELETLYLTAADRCTWPKDSLPRNEKEIVKDVDRAEKTVQSVHSDYRDYKNEISSISNILSNILVVKEAVENYTAGGITKMELALVMLSHKVVAGLEDLRDSGGTLEGALRPIDSSLRNAENDLHKGFNEMFKLGIPLLTSERIDNLSFLSFARSMGVEKITALYRNLSQNYPEHIKEIVELVIDNIGDSIRSTKNNIAECMAEAEGALTELSEELFEYQTSSKMNQAFYMQNFLQVDVFYRELNSEHIIQRPAFAASSLLGEVGGFLGLLLGASILTVCELLDYLFMSCWLKFQKKTYPDNDRRTSGNRDN